ncbi:MAG: hypothetical protein ABIM98_07335 [candidate division WOR-3 bacterium]
MLEKELINDYIKPVEAVPIAAVLGFATAVLGFGSTAINFFTTREEYKRQLKLLKEQEKLAQIQAEQEEKERKAKLERTKLLVAGGAVISSILFLGLVLVKEFKK